MKIEGNESFTGPDTFAGKVARGLHHSDSVLYELVSSNVSNSFAQTRPGGPLYATPPSLSYCEWETIAVILDLSHPRTHTSGRTPLYE
jgi:hypothetical protein